MIWDESWRGFHVWTRKWRGVHGWGVKWRGKRDLGGKLERISCWDKEMKRKVWVGSGVGVEEGSGWKE